MLLAEVTGFDLNGAPGVAGRTARRGRAAIGAVRHARRRGRLELLLIGHEDWREFAAEVKTLESAKNVRSEILAAFERAELTTDPDIRTAEMTFVIVGAGPTGVEMAGQIGELARDTLPHDFRNIDSRAAKVLLIDTGDRILAAFPPSLSAKAAASLRRSVATRWWTHRRRRQPALRHACRARRRSRANRDENDHLGGRRHGSGLAGQLGKLAGAEVDKAGRVTVEKALTLAGHPEVIALGDMVRVRAPSGAVQTLPGLAPVAIQEGHYAGGLVRHRLQGRSTRPFRYFDKGNVATIGRGEAVADLRGIKLSGLPAWIVWLFVHLYYLIGFQNRLLVMIQWAFSFFTHGRGARLIDKS